MKTTFRRLLPWCCCLGFILFGIIRITSLYDTFTQTNDEQAHLATGMQLLDQHRYDYETLHPPLARLMIATLPYLTGLAPTEAEYRENPGLLGMWRLGNIILYKNNDYFHNLTLARLGVLPFYPLAVIVLWCWCRRYYSLPTALAASFLFSTLPPILAHAMLATTDMAITATFSLAVFITLRWFEQPTRKNSLILGIATGLALLSKLSALIFLPFAIKLIRLYQCHISADSSRLKPSAILWAVLCFSFTVWSGYFFIHFPAYLGFERLIDGFSSLLYKQTYGHMLFFMGEVGEHKWYYFPVILFAKTPLPFLLLVALGLFALIRDRAYHSWQKAAPLIVIGILLTITMASRINMGIRHLLPIYPFLAIVAGYGVAWLWRKQRTACFIALGLLFWHGGASLAAHPYYLGYFNQLVAHPEHITLDSDLDWGQDLALLSRYLQQQHITLDRLYYLGNARPDYFGLPENSCNKAVPGKPLAPNSPGWYAASFACLYVTNVAELSWLGHYTPVTRIGTSILLYHIPE